jgi:hypothetical protein
VEDRAGENDAVVQARSTAKAIEPNSRAGFFIMGAVSAVGLIERFVDAPESQGAVPFYWRCGFDLAASSCAAEEISLLVGWPGRLRRCILIC